MLTNRQITGPSANAAGVSDTMPFHPLSIARAFWKHKWQILLAWVVLSAIAVAIVYRLPSIYEAYAVILVDTQKIPDKYVMSTVNNPLEDRLLTLRKQVLQSDSLQQVIDEFGLYKEQRKTAPMEEILDLMSKDVQVEPEKGWTRDRPGAIKITYQGTDPQLVQKVTHDIAEKFIDKSIKSREERASDTSSFLAGQLEEARKDLAAQEKKVSDYKIQHNGELPEQENSLGAVLSRLQLELQGNQDAVDRTQQQKLMLENSIATAESSIATIVAMAEQANRAPSPAGSTVNVVPQKESDLLQARLDGMRLRYSDDYPEVKRLRATLAEVRASEKRAEENAAKHPQPQTPEAASSAGAEAGSRLAPEVADKLVRERERLASLKTSLTAANHELESRSSERQKILANIKIYESRLEQLPMREQDMAAITRDYEISKENYRRLEESKNSADMAAQMEKQQQAEKLTLLQDARLPEIPVKPIRSLWNAGGCAIALVISLLIAAVREVRAGTVLGEWELPADVAVMGRVPWIVVDALEYETPPDTGSWLQRRWPAVVLSVLFSLACGVAAGFYQGWIKF